MGTGPTTVQHDCGGLALSDLSNGGGACAPLSHNRDAHLGPTRTFRVLMHLHGSLPVSALQVRPCAGPHGAPLPEPLHGNCSQRLQTPAASRLLAAQILRTQQNVDDV